MKQDKQAKLYPYLYQSIVLVALLIAAGLHFYKLDSQSFWNDEGNTARLVERPIRLVLSGAAGDVHPPGYYLLLKGWRALTGETEFALRSYSALSGILAVAFTASVAHTLIKGLGVKTRLAAIPALWFIVLNPLSVYYSQEARMYAQLGMVSAGVLWASVNFLNVMANPTLSLFHNRRIIAFCLLACFVTLGLYTHYAFVLTLLSLNCAFGLFWVIRTFKNWRLLLMWLGALAFGGLLFVPWAPVALRASGWRPPDLGAAHPLQALARTLVIGITLPDDKAGYILPFFAIFSLLILYKLRRAPFASWVALSMAYLPLIIIAIFGLYRTAYLKFLVISLTPLAVSISSMVSTWMGAVKNRHWIKVFVFCLPFVFLPAQVASLHHLYNDPAYKRDDYLSIVNFIISEAREEDAVLLNAPNQWEVFTYYYRGNLPIYTPPYRPDVQDALKYTLEIVEKHPQLFVLYWGDMEADPDRLIEIALAQQAFKVKQTWISSVRLVRYGTANDPMITHNLDKISLGPAIQLTGYDMPETLYNPGDILPITLFWFANSIPAERYKVFIHLVDDAGHLIAQTDDEPVGGFHLTNQWVSGEEIRDNYGVLLPDDISPGQYRILVGMYSFSGTRLQIYQNGRANGDVIHLDNIIVQSPR